MAPALVASIVHGAHLTAFAIFWLAVATDLLDGRVARRFGESSPLGGFLDHATDALFVASGLGAVAALGETPALLPPLVVIAFTQYALDSRVRAGRPLRASSLGRWNGIAYFVLLGVPVVRDALGLGWPPAEWVRAMGWALCASTVLSMGERAVAFVRQGRDESPPAEDAD